MVSMKALLRIALTCICFSLYEQACALTAYSKNDPYPVFSTLDPHSFLLKNEILKIIGDRPDTVEPNRLSFSISPFWQCADYGKIPKDLGCSARNCQTTGCSNDVDSNWCNTTCAELGDIDGQWNLLTLLYGKFPQGVCCLPPVLEEARQQLFPNDPAGYICDPLKAGCGFISFPGTYRKKGLRWEADLRLIDGFGVKFQSGIATMCLSTRMSTSCACNAKCDDCKPEAAFQQNVNKYLICKYKEIARQLCLDTNNFSDCYIEDIWATLWWRKPFELLESPECPHFVIAIPFLEIGGSFATGKPKDTCKPFSLSFGNNGHHAFGLTTGVDFNFVESIEFGGEFGLTHFFNRDIDCMHIANSPYQSGIYPFTASAQVSPGLNCHLAAKIACRHFLGCLSFWAQYLYINHQKDEITIKNCDSAFCTSTMERFTPWKVQLGNVGFNYDISAHLSLGVLWQIPIKQCNTYKTSTVLFSLNGVF